MASFQQMAIRHLCRVQSDELIHPMDVEQIGHLDSFGDIMFEFGWPFLDDSEEEGVVPK